MDINVDGIGKDMLKKLKVISEPQRFLMLKSMAQKDIASCCDLIDSAENGCCVTDLVELLEISQPTISHHLKVLEEGGLVHRERRRNWMCFFLNYQAVHGLITWLETNLLPEKVTPRGKSPMNESTSPCCPEESCCCETNEENETQSKRIDIQFLYVDLDECNRCQGTEANLSQAIEQVRQVLDGVGFEITLEKVHVDSEELARQLQLVTSPTIRINDHDIQPEIKETLCESCSDVAGEPADCRMWIYQGKDYSTPPVPMLVDAILGAAYDDSAETKQERSNSYEVPENLKSFFNDESGCC